jgi:uncharacterized 2Fe-2S/4Fe-4S cluster protein (DUF4445 family)
MSRNKATAYHVDFEPIGRRVTCRTGESLLDTARRAGVGINSICGGRGTCHACRLQFISGNVSQPSTTEVELFSPTELKKGWRLACQTYPRGDAKLHVPSESMSTSQRTQVEGLEVKVPLQPVTAGYNVSIPEPSMAEPRADAERLLAVLERQHGVKARRVDIMALRGLPAGPAESRVIVRNNEVITVGPPERRHLGMAVDLGTTKIAGYLVGLDDGRTLASGGMMNPQISYGEDIISRLNLAITSAGQAEQLRALAAGALNELAVELSELAGAEPGDIADMVVVGNTVMHHLLLGLPLDRLARPPFVPVFGGEMDIRARDLGLQIAPGAYVHLLPNIAGFVGADHTAMLLATGIAKARGNVLALDIGTNTEVSLVSCGRIRTVSCASGPAFEGGHITDGMRAAAGAIERLQVVDNLIRYQTIDGAPPVGICGSGILDAVAQLYLAGAIDEGGRMQPDHPLVSRRRGDSRVMIVPAAEREGKPGIAVTQADVREIQLAKAAIRTGIQVLLEAAECSGDELDRVVIAGAFGSYIDVDSAVNIGLLPGLPLESFSQVGNAAGTGARLALLSRRQRTAARRLAGRLEYIELAGAPGFNRTFIQAGYLGKYRITGGRRSPAN